MAGSPGRSNSRVSRFTNSAARCWQSAALPPFPQSSTLPPPRNAAVMRSAAETIASVRRAATSRCTSALFSKCARARAGRSDILERTPRQHPVALEQLADPLLQGAPGLKPRLAQALIGDDVVALVRIMPDRGELDVEVGHLLLHLQRQLLFREIGGVQADIIAPPGHRVRVPDAVNHAVGHVADVDEVTAEVL